MNAPDFLLASVKSPDQRPVMTYDQWKDPTEDTSEQERLEAEYEAEILIEYASDLEGWEPDNEPLLNPNQAHR